MNLYNLPNLDNGPMRVKPNNRFLEYARSTPDVGVLPQQPQYNYGPSPAPVAAVPQAPQMLPGPAPIPLPTPTVTGNAVPAYQRPYGAGAPQISRPEMDLSGPYGDLVLGNDIPRRGVGVNPVMAAILSRLSGANPVTGYNQLWGSGGYGSPAGMQGGGNPFDLLQQLQQLQQHLATLQGGGGMAANRVQQFQPPIRY